MSVAIGAVLEPKTREKNLDQNDVSGVKIPARPDVSDKFAVYSAR